MMTHNDALALSLANASALGLAIVLPDIGEQSTGHLSQEGLFCYLCPACEQYHNIPVTPQKSGPVWTWNGSLTSPTLSPSIKSTRYEPDPIVCHHFLKGGIVEVCTDSAAKPGQSLPLAVLL